jgi:hypothetical protein
LRNRQIDQGFKGSVVTSLTCQLARLVGSISRQATGRSHVSFFNIFIIQADFHLQRSSEECKAVAQPEPTSTDERMPRLRRHRAADVNRVATVRVSAPFFSC